MPEKSYTYFAPLPANFSKTYRNSVSAANLVKSVTDRRLDTFSSETTFILDIATHNKVSHLWLKSTGVTSVQVVINNAVVKTVTRAGHTVTDAQGRSVEWKAAETDGFDNWLIDVRIPPPDPNDPTQKPTPRTTSRVGVTVAGASRKVYELAAIDAQIALDAEERFSTFDFTPIWRGWTTHQAITGRLKGIPPLNSEPPRHDLDLSILYLDNAYHQPLLTFLYQNPNFCLVPEYNRYPRIVFTAATLPNWEMQLRRLVANLKTHNTLSLRISES